MKNNNNLEVILFSKFPLKDPRQKEPLKWMATTMQFVIRKQLEWDMDRFFWILEDTDPICMS